MLDELVQRAAGLMPDGARAALGITGPPGAGKSTLARLLVEAIGAGAVELPMDGFHLADTTLARLGRLDRKGAIDTFDGHGYLATLRRVLTEFGNTVYVPDFDRTVEEPIAGSIAVEPGVQLIVTEGNYLLVDDEPWPAVRRELAEVWYVELPDELRRARLVERHVRFGKPDDVARRWVQQVDEANARLITATRSAADLVVDMSQIEPATPAEQTAARRMKGALR